MKKENNKFACLIIGGGTLPIRCAEILLSSGHEVSGVASADDQVRKWSEDKNIPWFVPGKDLAKQISTPFDYLFSIVNDHILHEDVLRLPRKLAINYHDAPLPRYAGTHATSWALINGEAVHGISWHVVTDLVDGGDILKQREIDISRSETALTLNAKCYEAAIEAFAELVGDLVTGRSVLTRQDLKKRTFFPRFKRCNSVIAWNSRATDISALVRGLDFGPHPNPLGVAKVAIGEDFFVVQEVAVSELETGSSPGTINEIGSDFIRISTNDKDVLLRRLLRLDGQPISIVEFTTQFDLREGLKLTSLEAGGADRIADLIGMVCKFEPFWVEKLSTLEPAAPPFANATSAQSLIEHRTGTFNVPIEFAKRFSRSKDSRPLSTCLVAAFGAFLSRLLDAEKFDVGYSRVATKQRYVGYEGLFASQVPLRIEVDGSRNFSEILSSVGNEIESVERHGTFLLDLPARYPKLRMSSESTGKFRLPIAIAVGRDVNDTRCYTANELTLVVSEGGLECRLFYDKSKFEAGSIDRLVAHFETFLRGIAADPDREIARLPLLSDEERDRLALEWNIERINIPSDLCIHEFFEAQVERNPDAEALVVGRQRLTYRELDLRADRVGAKLRSLGVGPEVLVAICVERSIDLIAGILGILKAGGAYVPLDPSYPKPRLEQILNDSKAPVLLTQSDLNLGISRQGTSVVHLDHISDAADELLEVKPVSAVKPNNLAYVIYTSGSTGKPKGVAIEHRNTAAFLSWATSVFDVKKLRGTLASTSVCFDLSVFEIFAPLSCGGTVILVENILHLPAAPAAAEVTLINTVPSAIIELLRINGIPESVTTVNLAGEPLKTSLVRRIYETGTVREVYDLYGPTEDTTYSTFTLRGEGKATIGRPISNTQACVFDRNLQPVPIGIPGELYLGGAGLARGYLNQPELTAERFIKNPFDPDVSERLYKTGDLVRYLPSGEIEYLGRIDNQVKIRGFRIELGEVETVLSSHAAVAATAVIAREDEPGEKRLVAYFVPFAGSSVTIGELREYLKKTVPDFMVPSAFVELEELPLTPNGKIDRKALPPPSKPSRPNTDLIAHRDDAELKLIAIWEKILGIRPIGINDNFFELGGHSLKAIRMFAEVEETFGKNIPLATLFEAGTIEKLAAILRQEGWAAPESSLVPIQPEGTKPPFFCIHAKGGNVLFYRDLAKYMGEDQPFYGLQARRLAGRQIGHDAVEEMAEFYVREIIAVEPEGPYYLGGSSFGGLVAFEMAQQLQRHGKRIALLALLDTGAPGYPKILPNTTALRMKTYQLIRRTQHHRDCLKAFTAKERAKYILERLKKLKLKYRRKIRDAYKKSVRKIYGVTNGTSSIPANYIQVEDLIWKAGQKYAPKVYAGDLTLFRASIQPLGIYPDPTLGWESFVDGEIEMHEVPGYHGSIVAEPYVRTLAEKLGKCLRSVQLNEALFVEDVAPTGADARQTVQTARAGSIS